MRVIGIPQNKSIKEMEENFQKGREMESLLSLDKTSCIIKWKRKEDAKSFVKENTKNEWNFSCDFLTQEEFAEWEKTARKNPSSNMHKHSIQQNEKPNWDKDSKSGW